MMMMMNTMRVLTNVLQFLRIRKKNSLLEMWQKLNFLHRLNFLPFYTHTTPHFRKQNEFFSNTFECNLNRNRLINFGDFFFLSKKRIVNSLCWKLESDKFRISTILPRWSVEAEEIYVDSMRKSENEKEILANTFSLRNLSK